MGTIRSLDRRRWLTWSASGVLAVWSALDFGRGRRGWGIAIGAPMHGIASAQETEVNRPGFPGGSEV